MTTERNSGLSPIAAVHRHPRPGYDVTACCGRRLAELGDGALSTNDEANVTCPDLRDRPIPVAIQRGEMRRIGRGPALIEVVPDGGLVAIPDGLYVDVDIAKDGTMTVRQVPRRPPLPWCDTPG